LSARRTADHDSTAATLGGGRGAWALALALLATATMATYWPALDNGFVWDDGSNIVHNANLDHLDLDLMRWAFTGSRLGHYQPLTWLSLALDRALWGADARGFHLTSVLLQALNALLFAAVARRLLAAARRERVTAACGAAFVAAAVFALHPLRVESVAWATERRDLLSGAFFFATVLAYLAMVRRDRRGRARLGWGLGATLFFALSLGAKALALGLPLVLLVLDVYPLRRWPPRRQPAPEGGARRAAAVRLLAEKIPLFALALGFGLAALAAQAETQALVGLDKHGWIERLFQASYGAMFYPRAMFFLAWSPLYERPTVLDPWAPRYLFSALAFVVVTAALVALRRRFPAGLAVWLAYLILLAPVSGLAQSGIQLVADRYAYLAGLGFALLAGAGVAAAWRRCHGRAGKTAVAAVTLAVLSGWALLAFRQVRVWRDDVTLWSHVVAQGPSAMAYNNLGAMALQRGDRATALEFLRRSVEVGPAFGLPWRNMRALFEGGPSGLDREELRLTTSALEASLPNHAHAATAWTTVALAHLALGDRETAEQRLGRAVEVNPGYAPAWRLRGGLELAAADHAACSLSFAQATRLEPRTAALWSDLGICLEGEGQSQEAASAFERALLLDPNAARARERLRVLRRETAGSGAGGA
jgi:tetratricopeptide (TPR) repeat protein